MTTDTTTLAVVASLYFAIVLGVAIWGSLHTKT